MLCADLNGEEIQKRGYVCMYVHIYIYIYVHIHTYMYVYV